MLTFLIDNYFIILFTIGVIGLIGGIFVTLLTAFESSKLSTILIVLGALCIIGSSFLKNYENNQTLKRAKTLTTKYDFYLDGNKIDYPKMLNLDNYYISIDDENNAVILTN